MRMEIDMPVVQAKSDSEAVDLTHWLPLELNSHEQEEFIQLQNPCKARGEG